MRLGEKFVENRVRKSKAKHVSEKLLKKSGRHLGSDIIKYVNLMANAVSSTLKPEFRILIPNLNLATEKIVATEKMVFFFGSWQKITQKCKKNSNFER